MEGQRGLFKKINEWDGRSESGGYAKTADPSTALRSGRDDKGSAVAQVGVVSGRGNKPQVPPLRFAPVGMTRGVLWLRWEL